MEPGWVKRRRSGSVSRSHSGKCQATHHFSPPLSFLFQPLFHYLSLFVRHSQPHTRMSSLSPPLCFISPPFLPPSPFPAYLSLYFRRIFYPVRFLTVIRSRSAVFSDSPTLTLLFLLSSLSSAGSEHFLLGENLTVAVLGVVIPIGKSPGAFLSVCVCPH